MSKDARLKPLMAEYAPPAPAFRPCRTCHALTQYRVWREGAWVVLPVPMSPVCGLAHRCKPATEEETP